MNAERIERALNRIRMRFLERAARFDEEPESWITVNGNHIPLDADKKPMGGQMKAIGSDKEFRELEKRAKKWRGEHPFDPLKVLMGEAEEEPDFVKEYDRIVGERAEAKRRKEEEASESARKAEQKKVQDWEDSHKPEPYSAKRQYALSKYASKIGYNVVSPSMAKDFTDEEIHSIVDKIDEVQKEFGIDPEKHQIVYGIASADKGYQEFLDGAFGGGAIGTDGVMTLDPRKRYEYSNPTKRKNRGEYGIVRHEATHGLNMALADAMGESSHNGWSGAEKVARMVIEDALKKHPGKDRGELFTNISMYAGDTNNSTTGGYDYKEILAECVSSYMSNKNEVSDFARDVVDVLKGYCKKYMQ